MNSPENDNRTFLSLLFPNQQRIQAYILTVIPNISDAEDIYQDAVTEMWNKFDSFEVGTDFIAWAMTVTRYKILTFRAKRNNSKIHFSDKAYEDLSNSVDSKVNSLQSHLDLLHECTKKLSSDELFLLKLKYEGAMTYQKISTRTGKSAPAIHRIVSNIHAKLALCIRYSLRREEMT